VWINDQLMAAIRQAVANGVRFVDLFYDLTPVLDAGHSTQLRPLFERYVALLGDCASNVPAISQSSRQDLARYTAEKGWRTPPGVATGLPSGLTHGALPEANTEFTTATHEYALMVGTIEARKNHLLAFNVWQELINKHGADAIPVLVCVGKIGWNSDQFLGKMQETDNLNGKIQLRTDSVTDSELADLYRNCEFSIYPSDYEGWGLPVTESLYFGAPVVAANNSSLPEAGGNLAVYFETGNIADFMSAIEVNMLNKHERAAIKERIAQHHHTPITWESVAQEILDQVDQARAEQPLEQVIPNLTEWETYSLGAPHTELTDRLIVGVQRAPQPWGIPLYLNQSLCINFARPDSQDLTVHIGTLNEPGLVSLTANSQTLTFSRGEFFSVNVGAGQVNTPVVITLTAIDVGPSDQGFIGLTSVLVEGESAMASENLDNLVSEKLKAENQALRTDIAQLNSELESARAELARKSQGLLSRASRRLSRPVN
jgi:Glycosyl transferases group 1